MENENTISGGEGVKLRYGSMYWISFDRCGTVEQWKDEDGIYVFDTWISEFRADDNTVCIWKKKIDNVKRVQ